MPSPLDWRISSILLISTLLFPQAVLAGLRREGAMDGSLLQELGLAKPS
jgi:hypothetical protein